MISDQDLQLLSAFLDGELEDSQRETLEKRLALEPSLREYLHSLRDNDSRLKQVLGPIAEEPIPEPLRHLIIDDDSEADTQLHRKGATAHTPKPKKRLSTYVGPAIAASLVLGVGLFLGLAQENNPPVEVVLNELMQPSDKLVNLLDGHLSGIEREFDGKHVRLELSFWRKDGALCRQFLKQQAGYEFQGIACKENSRWQNVVLSPIHSQPEQDDQYRLADGNQNAISSYIMNNISGIPLSTEQERQLFP